MKMKTIDIRYKVTEDESFLMLEFRQFIEDSTSVSISVVRHPFERSVIQVIISSAFLYLRLVSAYQDKISAGYFRRLIERKYGHVSFPNFITFILRRAGKICRL